MEDDELLQLYLTGKLDEDKVEQVEHRLLLEDDFFELCEAVEEDLLAACIRGELSLEDEERVRGRLASSPRGADRFALTKGLIDLPKKKTQPLDPRMVAVFGPVLPVRRQPWGWASALAAALLLSTLGAWFVVELVQPQDVMNGIAQQETPRVPDVPSPSPSPPPSPEASPPDVPERPAEAGAEEPEPRTSPHPVETAVFQLSLAMVRGEGDLQQFRLPGRTGRVEFEIDVSGEEFASFGAVLSRQGHEVWRQADLEPKQSSEGATLTLALPAGDLEQGRYELAVEGVTPGGDQELLGAPEFLIVR